MTKLGINIDHVATVRQARKESFPDPVLLAQDAVEAGATGITAHLREDRRHIQDADIIGLKKNLSVPLNLEMAIAPEVVKFALDIKPAWCCLVPEKRQELTTEGGLNVEKYKSEIEKTINFLHKEKIQVSLFIEPDPAVVQLSKELKADAVELHTGPYARAYHVSGQKNANCSGTNLALRSSFDYELKKLVTAAQKAKELGLIVNAGHGLDYDNVEPISKAFAFHEFNIGFAIVAKALSTGMKNAVKEMKEKIEQAVCVES